jgi:hypothetical protein
MPLGPGHQAGRLIALRQAQCHLYGMKDPLDRIRELERHCEALENAIAEIQGVTWEPKITLPALRWRIAQILVAVRDRGKKPE